MSISRGFYIASYTAFMVALSVSLAMLLTFSGAGWSSWTLFGIPILIYILAVFVKEIFLKEVIDPNTGAITNQSSLKTWKVLYGIMFIVAGILLLINIFIPIPTSTGSNSQWVWAMLSISIIFFSVSTAVFGIWPSQTTTSSIFSVLGFITFAIAVAGIALTINPPWWIWLMLLLTIGLGIVSHVAELNSRPNVAVYQPNLQYTQTVTYSPVTPDKQRYYTSPGLPDEYVFPTPSSNSSNLAVEYDGNVIYTGPQNQHLNVAYSGNVL
jgi:hypothetical protein